MWLEWKLIWSWFLQITHLSFFCLPIIFSTIFSNSKVQTTSVLLLWHPFFVFIEYHKECHYFSVLIFVGIYTSWCLIIFFKVFMAALINANLRSISWLLVTLLWKIVPKRQHLFTTLIFLLPVLWPVVILVVISLVFF